jgi:hypothetical protein
MFCSKCGKEMKKGTLNGRGDNFFLPEGETSPKLLSNKILKKKNAILLPPSSFGIPFCEKFPHAFWCDECKLLIVDYSELM